jgi:hypothetical protein
MYKCTLSRSSNGTIPGRQHPEDSPLIPYQAIHDVAKGRRLSQKYLIHFTGGIALIEFRT